MMLCESAEGVHEKVIVLIKEEKRGRILDAPSGAGYLSNELKSIGFNPVCIDLDVEKFEFPDIEHTQADLNRDLPYEDGIFDYAVCVEGIEHIEDHFHLIREFKRVLKKGGKLIITTPNILNMFSRLRYLLIGYYAFSGGYYAKTHINLISFTKMISILDKEGLRIEKVTYNRNIACAKGVIAGAILWLLTPFIYAATFLKVKNSAIRQYLLSKELLFGECLIVKAVKS
ncbi:MAG: hypothetical protein B1H08_01695 [Candidatus Omnitrophica bacterium 4484_171]|nr:MAG: hypothetical protein B1H08_01695 [Candidatus Omnitrophica bacterium 4484_171]